MELNTLCRCYILRCRVIVFAITDYSSICAIKKVNVWSLVGVRLLILFIYGEIYGDLLK